jgi:type I restriction enzyme, S subunit
VSVRMARLGDIAEDLRSGFACGMDDPDGVIQFRMNNVERDGALNWTKTRRVPRIMVKGDLTLQSKDILLNATNSPDLVGKTALFLGADEPITFSNHFLRLRTSAQADPAYVARWLRRQFELGNFKAMCRSWVNQASITRDQVSNLEIPLPPLDEQKRIAATLDKVDQLRQKRRQAIALLDNLTQSTFLGMFGDLRTNSNGYRIVEVADVTDCIVPGRDKPRSFTGAIPWITTGELKPLGYTSSSSAKLWLSQQEISAVRAKVIPNESVILTCVGDLGVTSIASEPMVINQQLHSFQCSVNIVPEYLMFALTFKTDYMVARATKTTLPYMNKSVCNSIPIPLPPLDEQKHFRSLFREILTRGKAMNSACSNIDALFASLQHRAFTGQL